jgi:enoyl-CoA hydratase
MSTGRIVSLSYDQGVATVEIQREAQLNALNFDVLNGLHSALVTLSDECRGAGAYERCRAVVLRGAGERAFVAGADIKLMQTADEEQLTAFIHLGQQVMHEIEQLPLPVVALVQGFAIGGGLELALACDFIVAGEKARFGQAEVKLGLIPGFGGTQRLIARTGLATAKRLVLTGEDVSAEEAFRLGLVDYLFPQAELEKGVVDLCATLCARSPLALAAAKRAMEQFYSNNKNTGLNTEVREFLKLALTPDAREGMQAFVEKRKAIFSGKYE